MILQWNADHIFDQDPPVSQEDFPGGSDGNESVCNVRNPSAIPGLGISPGKGNGNSLQYSCLENSKDRGTWWTTIPGAPKSQTRLSE